MGGGCHQQSFWPFFYYQGGLGAEVNPYAGVKVCPADGHLLPAGSMSLVGVDTGNGWAGHFLVEEAAGQDGGPAVGVDDDNIHRPGPTRWSQHS